MKKILLRYKIISTVLFILVSLLCILNFNLKFKIHKLSIHNQKFLNYDEEFKIAKENRFYTLKNNLLNWDIVLDNISFESENIRFNIYKELYIDKVGEVLDFLSSISYLRIKNMDINKNNFSYILNISAEI